MLMGNSPQFISISNPQSQVISVLSNNRIAMNSSPIQGTHSADLTKQSKSKSLVSVAANKEIMDADLAGIPSHILSLQHQQPTLNIMTCGDVSHGKSTLLHALTGEKTGKHSRELRGNKTIRLGYTSCKIWRCDTCHSWSPTGFSCYFSTHSDIPIHNIQCQQCHGNKVTLLRHISFVDVPGHAELMQTMVSATSVADAAICVIDASKPCPGNQTAQHLDAIHLLGLMRLGQLLIAQNKIDLVSPSQACRNCNDIREFLHTFGDYKLVYETPIVPISAGQHLNMDTLCYFIVHHLPKYSRKLMNHNTNVHALHMNIIRSFDVNRSPDLCTIQDVDNIAGGVLGGAILSGQLRVGQMVEVRPGWIRRKTLIKKKNKMEQLMQSQWTVQPIRTIVQSMQHGKNKTKQAFAGGNVGVQTNIDPSLTKGDGMCGHIVVDASKHVHHMNVPPVFSHCILSYTLLSSHTRAFGQFETIKINIGAFRMKAQLIVTHPKLERLSYGKNAVICVLQAPICARVGDSVGICRQNKNKEWIFVGGAVIRSTRNIRIASDMDSHNEKKEDKVEKEAMKKEKKSKESDKQVACVNKSSLSVLKKTKDQKAIHLYFQQRPGRKYITNVVGLPDKINVKKIIQKIRKKWNTGATLVQHQEKGNVIQIQGDLREPISEWLVQIGLATKDQVTMHGY